MKLWIDDERPPLSEFTVNALSSAQAINILARAKEAGTVIEVISFDHDLGGLTGSDDAQPIMKWIIANSYWPLEMRFHTANPIGHKWLRLAARDEAPASMILDMTDPWSDPFTTTSTPWVDELLRRGMADY